MIKEVVFGKADWGYFVDIRGDSENDFRNIGIYQYKHEAKKIARERAKNLNIPLITDWGVEIQQPSCLDSILQIMGSKHPLRNKSLTSVVDGESQQGWLTKSGWTAYEKLIVLLYGIGEVCEVDVNDIVETLDTLVSSEVY